MVTTQFSHRLNYQRMAYIRSRAYRHDGGMRCHRRRAGIGDPRQSGIVYLLYFRLILDLGPTKAISVPFLVPVFGVLGG